MSCHETRCVQQLGHRFAVQMEVHLEEAYWLHQVGLPGRQSRTQQGTYTFPANRAKSKSRTGQHSGIGVHGYVCLFLKSDVYLEMNERG
jgi:hypothetical protein